LGVFNFGGFLAIAHTLSPVVFHPKNTLSLPKITHRNLSLTRNLLFLKSSRNPNLSKPSFSSSNGNLQQLRHQQTQLILSSESGGQAPLHGLFTIAGLLFGLHQDLEGMGLAISPPLPIICNPFKFLKSLDLTSVG